MASRHTWKPVPHEKLERCRVYVPFEFGERPPGVAAIGERDALLVFGNPLVY